MLVRQDCRHTFKFCTNYCFPRHQWIRNVTTMLRLYGNFMFSFALVFASRAELSTLTSNVTHATYKNTHKTNKHIYSKIFPSNTLSSRNNLKQPLRQDQHQNFCYPTSSIAFRWSLSQPDLTLQNAIYSPAVYLYGMSVM